VQEDSVGDLGLSSSFEVEAIRRDFPILREVANGLPLIWLDNGATTQKPQSVIDRISYFYEHENSNVHRAAHDLAARCTGGRFRPGAARRIISATAFRSRHRQHCRCRWIGRGHRLPGPRGHRQCSPS
jgi:cysteine desulfurase/selenocysteine lyase